MDELTVPFVNSTIPVNERPNKVIPVETQTNNLALYSKRFLDKNINTAIPNMNIDVLRARTNVAIVGSSPKSFMKESEKESNCANK